MTPSPLAMIDQDPPADPHEPAPTPERLRWRHLIKSMALTQMACLAVAMALALTGTPLLPAMLYSACIGTICALSIDGGRLAVARWQQTRPGASPASADGWPGWRWMLPIIIGGAIVGYLAGASLADLITGHRSALPWNSPWQGWTVLGVFSIVMGLLTTWFFHSRARVAAMEAEVARIAQTAAENQLKLLESQLEPHMMFNTLANLRVLIGVDPARAQDMLDRLIDFLRATLGASRTALHPLSAEFARLSDYLALMQIRMGDRLQVEFDLPDALAGANVPPLLLQPLVENAIKHGLEPQRAGGLLRVSARAGSHGGLLLQVVDTGRGRSAAAAADDGLPRSSFGLVQVRKRLATMYGDAATLTLQDGPEGSGTEARVQLPRA